MNKYVISGATLLLLVGAAIFIYYPKGTDPDMASTCPTAADEVSEFLLCSDISDHVKSVIQAQNEVFESNTDSQECSTETMAVDFTKGARFLSWTLGKIVSCSESNHPSETTVEKTINLETGEEVDFAKEFDIEKLTALFQEKMDLKSAKDAAGEACSELDEAERKVILGSPDSELLAPQFRFVEAGSEVLVEARSNFQSHTDRSCMVSVRFTPEEWRPAISKDSHYQNL